MRADLGVPNGLGGWERPQVWRCGRFWGSIHGGGTWCPLLVLGED